MEIMATRTTNLYGKIIISKRAIRAVVKNVLRDCYGIVRSKITHTETEGNRINIAVSVVLSYGLPPQAVCDQIRSTIKHTVEQFAGIPVDAVNVYVSAFK